MSITLYPTSRAVNALLKGRPVSADRVVVVGAGVGGLVAALELSHHGCDVTLVEAAQEPGGKMRQVATAAGPVDAGPTVFTLRGIFESLFDSVGESLDARLSLIPLEVLARHAWREGESLDLHADPARSADAIGAFAGRAEAEGYRRFAADARRVFDLLDTRFMQAARPGLLALAGSLGLAGLSIRPFESLWRALGDYFRDPRLHQLFGRYATYCGSSPFLAPATLMLVAHAEQAGVWSVEGGMHRLAACLAGLAVDRGATLRFGTAVESILTGSGEARGVRLADGEILPADAVVLNADSAALWQGLLGPQVAGAVPRPDPGLRSLSAVTWCLAAEAQGFPLARHSVFFSSDYRAEFAAITDAGRLPDEPTVYVCAQDRTGTDAAPAGAERLFCLVNAPARGDEGLPDDKEIERCETAMMMRLARSGLRLAIRDRSVTGPTQFARMFPGTGGSLYGTATHGAMASFRRPGSRTAIRRLYLAGGSVHPGPGVPMVALSGRLAARTVLADLTSHAPWRRMAMPGGMSMR
jgi:1-hydroxycarotenoid 3,4-desaturase